MGVRHTIRGFRSNLFLGLARSFTGGQMTPRSSDKLSEKIGEYEGGEYWITAAIWRTRIEHQLFVKFEIGFLHKKYC
jgi:hypothetical protein